MNLEPIAEYLELQGAGTRGTNIFVYSMPDEIISGVLLVETLLGTTIDHELPNYRRADFQVIVRHSDFAAGKALAEQVSNLLTLENKSATINGMNVKFIRPKHEPVPFPRLEGGGLEFSVNFESAYVII